MREVWSCDGVVGVVIRDERDCVDEERRGQRPWLECNAEVTGRPGYGKPST